MAAPTRFPVVLIHGVFGFGRQRPLWNLWVPYWPERHLRELNPNHVIVGVSGVSSDHDRACEAFYQLYGGRVDYGEQHSAEAGHDRYGEVIPHEQALHPKWSEDNPVHLLGHSFGSTTAIELYQLLCADFFGVGSDHKWVRSIVSIAGPLTGSTLSYVVGVRDGKVRMGTAIHLLAIIMGGWVKLCMHFPALKGALDLRMEHWGKLSLRQVMATSGPLDTSMDTAIYNNVPTHRMQRNATLKHMDKLFLMSIATSPRTVHVPAREAAALAALLAVTFVSRSTARSVGRSLGLPSSLQWLLKWSRGGRALVAATLVAYLVNRAKQLDVSKLPSMYGLKWLIQRRAKSMPMLVEGFEPDHWKHNDGAVNIRSMLRPWFPTPQEVQADISSHAHPTQPPSLAASSSSASLAATATAAGAATSSMERCQSHISIDGFHKDTDDEQAVDEGGRAQRFDRGRWYVYRVDSNHLAGTYWHGDAPDLYKSLFLMMANEYERVEDDRRRETRIHVLHHPMRATFS